MSEQNIDITCHRYGEDKEIPMTSINPSHYRKGKVECYEAIDTAITGLIGFDAFCTGQVIKYMWRWKNKHPRNPVEDLKKANWYLQKLIEKYEKEGK